MALFPPSPPSPPPSPAGPTARLRPCASGWASSRRPSKLRRSRWPGGSVAGSESASSGGKTSTSERRRTDAVVPKVDSIDQGRGDHSVLRLRPARVGDLLQKVRQRGPVLQGRRAGPRG